MEGLFVASLENTVRKMDAMKIGGKRLLALHEYQYADCGRTTSYEEVEQTHSLTCLVLITPTLTGFTEYYSLAICLLIRADMKLILYIQSADIVKPTPIWK